MSDQRPGAYDRPPELEGRSAAMRLHAVRLVHTLVWAFFVACIAAVFVLTATAHFGAAALCAGAVAAEVVVLLLNRMRCPLTAVAARYTDDRRANFDIYLPEWLAQHNQAVFGGLYLAAVLFLAARCASG